jgi:hypothetical protein
MIPKEKGKERKKAFLTEWEEMNKEKITLIKKHTDLLSRWEVQ